MGSLNLNPRVWRLQPWDKNFNPYSQKNTSVQASVCLWDLPWVYWHPQILADISIPLRFDQATINGDFGHYARVLVDIDLKNPLLYQIEVDSEGDCVLSMRIFLNFVLHVLPLVTHLLIAS